MDVNLPLFPKTNLTLPSINDITFLHFIFIISLSRERHISATIFCLKEVLYYSMLTHDNNVIALPVGLYYFLLTR